MGNILNAKHVFEKNMDIRPGAEDKRQSGKVFSTYPILGEYMPSDTDLEQWHKITRNYLEKKINDRSAEFADWVYEQIALVIIHYAKDWNSNEEGRFTKYVPMQLGYKDDTGKVWYFLAEALEKACKQNDRLFIVRNEEREFYETVMVHSFGPNGAWFPMIDLLFSFYTDNLDWTYIPNDPLFSKLVKVLQAYFNHSDIEDDQCDIASQKYRLRIGIRRLVQERPLYSAYLFESLVKRIHSILNNNAQEAETYSQVLVDQWFSNRIANASEVSKKRSSSRKNDTEVALDYSKISVRYVVTGGQVALRIPAIRLLGEEQGKAVAELYEADRLLERSDLEIRGNELGETIRQKTIVLPDEQLFKAELSYRIIIRRGETVIYDSDSKLWRQVIFFSDGKEISASRIRKEKYEVFIPDISKLNVKNIDIESRMHGIYEMAFHKDYILEYAESVLSVDASETTGLRILAPTIKNNARYIIEGDEYSIIKNDSSVKVYCETKEELKKYRVIISGQNHSLLEYFDSFANNRSVVPLDAEYKTTTILITDLEKGTILFKENYYVVPGFKCEFNENVYVSEEGLANLSAQITCGDDNYVVQTSNYDEIQLEHNGGSIVVDVPRIYASFYGVSTVFFDKYLRAEDISVDSGVSVVNRTRIPCTLKIGETTINNPSEVLLLQYISDAAPETEMTDIILEVAGKEWIIGKVVFRNSFVQLPQFVFKDDELFWDGGISYIGDADASLRLSLKKEESLCYSFDLVLGEELICRFKSEEFVDGQYTWIVYANEEIASQGSTFIGNISKARFFGKTIFIDSVTEDVEDNSKPVPIKPVYIDQIKYRETCYVDTEEDVYDIYSGCMYWIDWNGRRRYYSFRYSEDSSRYKINPVKIIYISDKYLRIVNEDDEGIFYFYKDDYRDPGNEITDREPSVKAKDYHDILFCLFNVHHAKETESDKHHAKAAEEKAETVIANPAEQNKEYPTEKQRSAYMVLHNLKPSDQDTVIKAPVEERILVNAGPGTGKTWTLIERIIYLVQRGTDPEAIQVLCFSRAAVEVVRQRMADAIREGRVDVSINLVDIRTFDSFASQLLYWVKDSDYAEVGKNFSIETLNYEQRIDRFIDVLNAQPGLIEQCEHLIVDEVQDLVLNRATMVLDMIRLLPSGSGVTLFGDACQAIYDYQVKSGMSSDIFYSKIEESGQFSYYSFDHNYRQVSLLQDYCNDYRKAILSADLAACRDELHKLREDLPDYDTINLSDFQEDSLDRLLSSGNVGILTRSNAQALVISGMFHKKNIPHLLQRRLTDNYLNGWIAALFNNSDARYYDEKSFTDELVKLPPKQYEEQKAEEIWSSIVAVGSGVKGSLSGSDLLRRIRDYGRSKELYVDNPSANVIVSTIHRSKGREYDSVIILDSLIAGSAESLEEQRVNYVALSRARDRMYKTEMPSVYFGTVEQRRCYYSRKNYHTGKFYLDLFEIGRPGDFSGNSFCCRDGVQLFLRENMIWLKDQEVYLEKEESSASEYVVYSMKLKENDMILGQTSRSFSEDLESAIRKTKNLPWNASILDYVYPKRFNGIYIMDIASEIGMIQGNEKGIREFNSLGTWNTVLAEGYAKAEY